MLQEFKNGRQVTFRVNPRQSGTVETVNEVYAVDYFKAVSGDATQSPVTSNTNTAGGGSATASAPSRKLRRRVQAVLERLFLPAGYPNSVTDDLLGFALWDAVQVLATSVMATLSTRAVLLGVGVGASGANLTSSTLSWMMRDGTWLLGSIFFASIISQDLEYRAKTWRLVADITNDGATFLELCAPLLPGGQTTFRLVVVLASVIKALVGVCGGGTRASFTQHFALCSNAADVAAKAGTRGNVGSLIGLALGMAVAYLVPASSTLLNLTVFALSTSLHLFANYRGVRGVQLRRLNAPRLEWALEQFCRYQDALVIANKREASGGRAAVQPLLDISVRRANAAEPLFILPALPPLPPPNAGPAGQLCRLARRYLCPPSLSLRIHCGASLYRLLVAQRGLSTARKHELVNEIESSLSTRGIALLFNESDASYYVLLPEFYTVEGVPESWVRYKRQLEHAKTEAARHRRSKKAESKAQSKKANPSGGAAGAVTPPLNDDDDSNGRGVAEEAADEALAEIERLRKERVVVPPHILPLPYRELWAFFYAYMHNRATSHRRERGITTPHRDAPPVTATERNSDTNGPPAVDVAPASAPLRVITRLRADGLLEDAISTGSQGMQKDTTTATTAVDAAPITPTLFEEMTSPTSTTSPKLHLFPSPPTTSASAETDAVASALAQQDGLYPLFVEFVRGLRKTGWELDRLLIDHEGCTTVVHYL